VYHVIPHLPAALPFYSWIIFYEFGLLYGSRDKKAFFRKDSNMPYYILVATMVCLFISQLEGMVLLLKYDNLEFAITSIKYSSFLYSSGIILGFLYAREHFKFQPSFLVAIGNYSFGIYLIHSPVLNQIAKLVQRYEVIYSIQPLYQVIITLLTLSLCVAIISVTRVLAPKSFCHTVFGF